MAEATQVQNWPLMNASGPYQYTDKSTLVQVKVCYLIMLMPDGTKPLPEPMAGISLVKLFQGECHFTDDKSTLAQLMAWCCQTTMHYPSQSWPRSMSPYGVIRPQWVKGIHALPGHNVLTHHPLDIIYFQMNFHEWKVLYFDNNFTDVCSYKSPIDNNPALAQIMAWRRIGDKPLSEPVLTWFTDAYMRH